MSTKKEMFGKKSEEIADVLATISEMSKGLAEQFSIPEQRQDEVVFGEAIKREAEVGVKNVKMSVSCVCCDDVIQIDLDTAVKTIVESAGRNSVFGGFICVECAEKMKWGQEDD